MYVIVIMALLVGIVMNLENTVETVVIIQAVATVLGSITMCSLIMLPKFAMRNQTRADLIAGGINNTSTGTNVGTAGGTSEGSGSARIEELEEENEALRALIGDYKMQLGLDDGETGTALPMKQNETR